MTVLYEMGTDERYAEVETIRVSVNDEFVTVTRYDDPRYPIRWMHVDESGPVVFVLEHGRGEPPARLFPPSATMPA